MATAIDPTDLITDARCYSVCIPSGLQPFTVLAALIDVANGDPVPTDTNELIDEARCLESCIPTGMVWAAMIVAIQDISGGGGPNPPPPPPSLDWTQNYSGIGSPEGVVTPTYSGTCFYMDTSDGTIYVKNDGLLNNTGWA
jgi:hypothetical protein